MGKVGGKIMIPLFHPLATCLLSTSGPIGLTATHWVKTAAAFGASQINRDLSCRMQRIIGIAIQRYACQIGKPRKITL